MTGAKLMMLVLLLAPSVRAAEMKWPASRLTDLIPRASRCELVRSIMKGEGYPKLREYVRQSSCCSSGRLLVAATVTEDPDHWRHLFTDKERCSGPDFDVLSPASYSKPHPEKILELSIIPRGSTTVGFTMHFAGFPTDDGDASMFLCGSMSGDVERRDGKWRVRVPQPQEETSAVR